MNKKQPWSERLPMQVHNYNNALGHKGSFGSTPAEVISKEPRRETEDNALDFQVMRMGAPITQQRSHLANFPTEHTWG